MGDRWADGDAYERFMGRWSRELAPRFLAWADVPAPGIALDVGCGTGALSAALLARGAERVVGVDASPAFVAAARERLPDPRASFREADATKLDFPDAHFDAVASSLVLNFVPGPERAAAEMARVARPGAVVAACVWDYAEGMQMLRRFWDAALALDPQATGDEGARFPLCRPEPLERLFRGAGLGDVRTGPIEISTRFRDFDDYWTPFLGGTGPAPQHVASLPEPSRAALRDHLRATLPRAADGSIPLTARAWAVRGTKE